MLEIRKTAIAFEETELIDLERIILDGDSIEALKFLKKVVYDRILKAQQGKLKSHLNGESNPIESFKSTGKTS
ncbi:MAG: hypothetical protein NUV31_02695 [Dehalococcoidales bacterium]|nr:hypothetical protein [Dehalococcoidales bacterium]